MNKIYLIFITFLILSLSVFGMQNISLPLTQSSPDLISESVKTGSTTQKRVVYYKVPFMNVDSVKIYYTDVEILSPIDIDSIEFNKLWIQEMDSLCITDTNVTRKITRFLADSRKMKKDDIDIRAKMSLYERGEVRNLYFDEHNFFITKGGRYRISQTLYDIFGEYGTHLRSTDYTPDSILIMNGFVFADGTEPDEDDDEERVYWSVEEKASFPGGQEAFEKWIDDNLIFPSEMKNVHGNFLVFGSFTVNKDGSIEDIRINRTKNEYFIKEVKRLCEIMPKWIPAKLGGKVVRGWGHITLFFRN